MKTTLNVNSRGTLTLPKAIRKTLGVSDGGVVILSFDGDGFVLRPAATFPIEIYSDSRVAEFDDSDAELQKLMKGSGENLP